ncbi:hypothetical protein KIN20_034298 [Parelaphostrongylus tenuis]|uniref:Negative elongation factor E n=1 Tax=Parelaphostrongylus tenuis TaxID=148309 RepID=A0AAD5R9D6_PARTN|nr:hypothetical protein KIN20_034298 [Parelaphostrongylus tenuis]
MTRGGLPMCQFNAAIITGKRVTNSPTAETCYLARFITLGVSSRVTSMNTIVLPTTLSDEERALKEMHEKLKQVRRLISERRSFGSTDVLKIEKNKVKNSLEQAEVATEELKRKVMSGAITVKKIDEKQTFKRARVDRRRRTVSTIEEGEIVESMDYALTPVTTSSFTCSGGSEECHGRTIVIRGSPFQKEEVIREYGKFGEILSTKIDNEQKLCFVQFKKGEEALTAVKEMNGIVINGIKIEVSMVEQQNSGNSVL